MSVSLRYDPDADALYVELATRLPADVARTVEIGAGRQVDYDASGSILGVEFLEVSAGVHLEGVPHADEIREALAGLSLLSVA